MKNLHFDYYMQIDYMEEVSRCNFTIKCFPKDNARQRVRDVMMEMHPNSFYNRGSDGLGNAQIYGLNGIPHKTFIFHITGAVQTGLADYEEEEREELSMIFRHPHGLNRSGEMIRAYYQKICPDLSGDVLSRAEGMMHRLYEDFHYQPCSTTFSTGAEEAFSQGCGVCQDYAHIFISLLHMEKIAARYVTGLLIGEGASHAWVEVLMNGKWYGLDPTNNCRVTEDHIKIGVGRDASDCTINRGLMHGGGLHTQSIRVSVGEDEND